MRQAVSNLSRLRGAGPSSAASSLRRVAPRAFSTKPSYEIIDHDYDAVVVGTPSERWGSQVTAVVQIADGASRDEEGWKDEARRHIAGYKLPKAFVVVDAITRSPSGKADYKWARDAALAEIEAS